MGTIEAHGPGALGTDAIIPAYLVAQLAEPLNALIAPEINYGITRSLIGFPGSLTVGPETFERYVTDVGLSLGQAGFKRIIIVNGHGGNTEQLKRAGQRLWEQAHLRSVVVNWWLTAEQLGVKHFGGIGHAMADELGALQAIDPSLVTRSDYRAGDAGAVPAGIMPFPHHRAMIAGQPGRGDPQFNLGKSKKYLNETVALITRALREIMEGWDQIG